MAHNLDVENLIKLTWDEINKSGEKTDFSTEQRKEIQTLIRTCVENEMSKHKSLSALPHDASPAAVEKLLKKHLKDDRIQMIRDGFTHETFTMKITEDGGQPVARISRNGEKFKNDIALNSAENIVSAKVMQIASFIVELIMLILSVNGIKVNLSKAEMQRLIQEVEPIAREPAVQRMINAFLESWRKESAWARAEAIFVFIKDTSLAGIFWKLVKIVIGNMSWLERARTIAMLAAMIVAAFATEGVALIGKILLSLNSAVTIVQKVLNVIKLKELHTNASK